MAEFTHLPALLQTIGNPLAQSASAMRVTMHTNPGLTMNERDPATMTVTFRTVRQDGHAPPQVVTRDIDVVLGGAALDMPPSIEDSAVNQSRTGKGDPLAPVYGLSFRETMNEIDVALDDPA